MTDKIELLKPKEPVGVVGYGAYVPRYRLPAKEVARIWTDGQGGLPIVEKSVPGPDEDVATMSIEAARNALKRAEIHAHQLRAVWVGSESHPYAVKPTSTIVAEAIGAVPSTQAADWEFACKAGTEAMVAAMGMVGSGMADYTLAIGMDTAQGRPGDPVAAQHDGQHVNLPHLADLSRDDTLEAGRMGGLDTVGAERHPVEGKRAAAVGGQAPAQLT